MGENSTSIMTKPTYETSTYEEPLPSIERPLPLPGPVYETQICNSDTSTNASGHNIPTSSSTSESRYEETRAPLLPRDANGTSSPSLSTAKKVELTSVPEPTSTVNKVK